jgi:3-oxoacyl-[acyl-carrier-protein] synthase-3
MAVAIRELHYCLAPEVLKDQDLEQYLDPKQLKTLTKMSGIHARRVAPVGVTALDLAFVAAKRLLDEGAFSAEQIDLLVFATQTPDHQIPATACELHGRLGLSQSCGAFDVNLGCSAFPYCLAIVSSMIEAGLARNAMLCNADVISHVVNRKDRSLAPLHGDGAAICILTKSLENNVGLEGFLMGTDGENSSQITIPASGLRQPRTAETKIEEADDAGSLRNKEQLYMNGPAVFHFSIDKIPSAINDYLKQEGLTVEDLDLVLLHQANKTMVDLIYRALDIPKEKRFYFMETVGNLAGASTPILLAEAWRSGRIKPGGRILLASFGNGLSWAVTSMVWSDEVTSLTDLSVEFDSTLTASNEV